MKATLAEAIAAIDAANCPEPLCLLCRASYALTPTSLCASCLYEEPAPSDDDTQPTTSEAHAA